MAKTYSFVDLPKPVNCTATPSAGGTLVNGTTYYYRLIGTYSSSAVYWFGKSQVSDEFSGTADASNGSMTISFDSPIGDNNYYRIFRSTVTNGQFGKAKMIRFYPADATYNSGGTVTFVDNGYAILNSNYFLEDDDNCHGRLTISGSASDDKFSIVDLYDEDVAQGWGVIEKLSYDTYKINCRLVLATGQYWQDTKKTIIFVDGTEGSSQHWEFGSKAGVNQTEYGCHIISRTCWLSSYSWGELNAYRTTFEYVDEYKSNFSVASFTSGIMQDSTVDTFRGFYPTGNLNCTFKNCIFSNFDNLFSAYAPTVDGLKCLGGSRIWQIGGGSTNVVARGLNSEGTSAVLVVGGVTGASLTIIDSIITGNPMFGNYAANDGFKYYDQFSFNLNITENDTLTPLAGVTVKIYDKDSVELFSVETDVNGDIVEQLITRNEGVAIYPDYIYELKGPFELVVSKTGYESYREPFDPTESLAIVKKLAVNELGTRNATKIYDSSLYNSTIY